MSWFGPKNAYKSINDIEQAIRTKRSQKTKIEIRSAAKIAVVDDQPFDAANNLKNNHYQIDEFTDVRSVRELVQYPIILCDLQGVGAQLNQTLQGAHLIHELKENFPEKIVIAYTGGAKSSVMAQAAQRYADRFLKKDASIEEWIEVLDDAMDKVTDPVFMWKEFRKRLLDASVTPIQLAALEQAYVEGLTGGPEKTVNSVTKAIEKLGLHGDIRGIIQGFISAVAFKLLIG